LQKSSETCTPKLVSWSLTSLFSTKTAISETMHAKDEKSYDVAGRLFQLCKRDL